MSFECIGKRVYPAVMQSDFNSDEVKRQCVIIVIRMLSSAKLVFPKMS